MLITGVNKLTTLTDADFSSIRANLRVFVRLFGLDVDPLHAKYAANEFDTQDALHSIGILLKATARFEGKRKHSGVVFDFVEDVKSDMTELLLTGLDSSSSAVLRKRHLSLFHLVVIPTLEFFRGYTHKQAVEIADEVIDYISATAFNEDDYGTYDDALIAREQTRNIIRLRDEQAKLSTSTHRKKNKAAMQLIEVEMAAVS